jgi:hypothetical protein
MFRITLLVDFAEPEFVIANTDAVIDLQHYTRRKTTSPFRIRFTSAFD